MDQKDSSSQSVNREVGSERADYRTVLGGAGGQGALPQAPLLELIYAGKVLYSNKDKKVAAPNFGFRGEGWGTQSQSPYGIPPGL